MSTFNGIVKEFPQIQFDYFRKIDDRPPSLANFLSHIHSDHLTGLASKTYRAPFIYCSAATKNLLLKLERRAHRLNYAKKLVESHQYSYLDYARREKIIRVLPLETPTEIELQPGYTITVTLFDANHCPGSTMFLVEGGERAILYTGDIRAEAWWIEKLKRSPILLPYFYGIKKLDCLYLDTTHASLEASHLRFSSKADGIAELLIRTSKYPPDTVFHLNTWTLGYEDAWVALATHFKTQIHIDDYRMRLFNTLAANDVWEHGPFLLGNGHSEGVLTDDKNVLFHSCEKWLECEVRDQARKEGRLVEISPLVAKYKDEKGEEYLIKEPGEGGGNFDANPVDEISGELVVEVAAISNDPELRDLVKQANIASRKGFMLSLDASTPEFEMTLEHFIGVLKKNIRALIEAEREEARLGNEMKRNSTEKLPQWFGYPFSRHSSFFELQDFVKALGPKDVYPCVAADGSWYQKDSIRKLFGKYCSGDIFAFDVERGLDIEYAQKDKEDEEHRVMEELRAAGMEQSQQAQSQFSQNSTQNSQASPEFQNQGETQPDYFSDFYYPESSSQFARFRGDTQVDATDPFIQSKVEKALNDAAALARSVKISESHIQVERTPSQTYRSMTKKDAEVNETPTRGSRRLSALDYSLHEGQEPGGHMPSNVSSSSGPQKVVVHSGDTTLSTDPGSPHEKDEMDCSQDSYASFGSVGDLDRGRVMSVIKAVDTGNWIYESKRLEFNNDNWKYQKEEEL